MSTTEQIRQHIEALPLGEPFATNSLLSLGSRAAVDQALSRLAKEGVVLRVARGAYVRPKESRFVGKVLPEVKAILEALAGSRGEKIQAHGAQTVLKFGLTTQVPMKPLFYTSGPSRTLQMGNLEVVLKRMNSRLLPLSGTPAGEAFSALWYMGKKQVTPETIAVIKNCLPQEEFAKLKNSPQLPSWLAEAFHRFEGAGAYA